MTSNASRRGQAAGKRTGGPAADSPSAPGDMWQLRGPDGAIASGWYLLPLRLFLGVTFVFAGLQKLANPDFFRASSPISIHAQLIGTTHTSPIGDLLSHLAGGATVIGALMAVAEVAIGVGALLGLLTRVAAIGGVLVTFGLFLAISFHAHPFYTGSDLVFAFAWTPFVLAGAAGAPAVDTWLEIRGGPSTAKDASRAEGMSRGAFIGTVAAGTAVLVGAVAGIGRIFAPSASTTTNVLGGGGSSTTTTPPVTTTSTGAAGGASTTTTTAPTPAGTAIGAAAQVPVGGSASFTDPTSGDPSLVIQHTTDKFVAFDAICPHAGCTVAYQAGANIIACPCHGSEFNARTGAVVTGPATSGLTPIKVIKGSNGNLYVV
ncbi:MAG TPA: Rieske 2Fe-2S domain-containing protein [Acidimicrobiales bacterium]